MPTYDGARIDDSDVGVLVVTYSVYRQTISNRAKFAGFDRDDLISPGPLCRDRFAMQFSRRIELRWSANDLTTRQAHSRSDGCRCAIPSVRDFGQFGDTDGIPFRALEAQFSPDHWRDGERSGSNQQDRFHLTT